MHKKRRRVGLFVLLVFCMFSGWWIKAAIFAKSVRFDLRQASVAKQFEVSNAEWATLNAGGIRLACPQLCYCLGPVFNSEWDEFPYVKVRVTESAVPSDEILVLWAREDGAGASRRVKPTTRQRVLIASAKTYHPWEQQMPWRGPIHRVGIGVSSGTVSISDIVLTDSLTPWEWVSYGSGRRSDAARSRAGRASANSAECERGSDD